MKIIKCSWYENYSKKLCDHEFLVGLIVEWNDVDWLPGNCKFSSTPQFRREKFLNPAVMALLGLFIIPQYCLNS